MSKIIYINENHKILKANSNIVEGGLARNIAIMTWLQKNIDGLIDIKLSNSRLINILIVFGVLLCKRKATIIFQYVTVGVPLFNGTVAGKIISALFISLTRLSSRFNDIIFDVSDLKYEQSIDLEIEKEKIERVKDFENKFFKLKVKFIFASFSMQRYACDKYNITIENTEVIINGGNVPENKYLNLIDVDLHKLNFVYAGTLNKGRKIEEMIKQFPNHKGIHLYLMGSEGDWIKEAINGENITYMGQYPEEEAHDMVKLCDIGLIPYDNNRSYYNIAFPTKLSFYLTAGIPFLSTPVSEVLEIKNKYNIGFVEEINNWASLIISLDKRILEDEKTKIRSCLQDFTWQNIISESKFFMKLTK